MMGVSPVTMDDVTSGYNIALNLTMDSLDNDRKSLLLEVAQNGSIVGDVVSSYPAAHLTDPEMFRSLFFYYGMLTFAGTDGFETTLVIPNLNVRTQY
jgi:hypothetical protein